MQPGTGHAIPRIIVIDHDALSRCVIAKRVERCGFEAVPLGSANAVIDYLLEHPVAAVISDAHLPEDHAVALARQLRALRPGLPVLWMSSTCDNAELQSVAAQYGVRCILGKQAGADRELQQALSAALAAAEPMPILRRQDTDFQFAHSLRTPLTALKTAVDLLRSHELGEPQRHFANVAHRNVERMIALIEQLLRDPSTSP